MPIEDIDYLYQNSVKESIIIFVDSSKRDKNIYPYPSEFQVDFVQPYNYVYGIEVLDTTIPRTMFMMEYINNELLSKFGFRMLSDDILYKHTFLPQDFSRAEVFFNRINEQLNNIYGIDNYDNVMIDDDNSFIMANRLQSDYPIPRFYSQDYPFVLDMKSSTCYNIFGFDKYVSNDDFDKYMTFDFILHPTTNYNVNKHSKENKDPFEHSKIINNPQVNGKQTVFHYLHKPKYRCDSFLQQLILSIDTHYDEFIDIIDDESYIYITLMYDNSILFENKRVLITPSQKYLTIDTFLNVEDTSYFGNVNTHLKLQEDARYQIIYSNLKNKHINLQLGYSYFMNLHNIENHEKMFISKPIYDPSNTITIQHNANDETTNTLCSKVSALQFDLLVTRTERTEDGTVIQEGLFERVVGRKAGTLIDFKIEVQKNNNIKDSDIFVLNISRYTDDVQDDESHSCDIFLTYEENILQNNIKKYFLIFKNTEIDRSIFNYVHLDYDNLSIDVEDVNIKYKCMLYSNIPIYVIGNSSSFNYQYTYLSFDHFGLISPGMINLASENYIILRCEEIENHLRGSHDSKDLSPGLGVLNIDVQGYASTRNEFFSVKYKEFHPIGKLSKMKFRFERKRDGMLYDFKQIDLHFLLSINFLRPKQKAYFSHSILNPNYNPNYLGYINKNMEEYDDDSTDDSDIEDEYFESVFNDKENMLRKQHEQYTRQHNIQI